MLLYITCDISDDLEELGHGQNGPEYKTSKWQLQQEHPTPSGVAIWRFVHVLPLISQIHIKYWHMSINYE